MKKINSTKQINRSYHSHIKTILKGSHEKEIFDSLSAGKNSYLRLDRLASSSFDKSWIEVIEDCIFDLGTIIANPKMNTKVEGSLTPVELARKINSESVQHLASHTQYIKEVDEYGNVIPSKLLSMYADDDIHTYENRFIATFVRRLMLFITKRYEYVTKYAELRNEEYLYFKNKSIVDGAEVEIETKVKVSYKSDDEQSQINSGYVDRIRQTREYIMYFYNSPFMKAMKNEKDVRNPILQTNIIRKNVKYHHCYEVYKFIETYDRLGVNYKIDENYSLFNDEEINELNRTLFANYITLKGKELSKEHKTNSKVYKPRILTSAEDEAFIYGPLLEGPIEFARVDAGYQQYLESKLRKDLPLHPTKKEREYYADEYAAKNEFKQDQKELNDLLKRRQKEVNAFEKQVKNILIEREKARQRLLELEKETIRREEEDLLEAARREIMEASRQDITDKINADAKQAAIDNPQPEPQGLADNPVTFDEAINDVFDSLTNPQQVEDNKQPVVEETHKEEQKVLVPTVSFEEAANEIWPQLNNPIPVVVPVPAKAEETQPVENKETPVVAVPANEEQPKAEQKVLVPTVSFDDAANEIWPQLNNPTPIAVPVKEEPQEVKPAEASKEETKEPVKEIPDVLATKAAPVEEKPTIKEEEQPVVVVLDDNAEQTVKIPEEGTVDARGEYVKVESPIFRRTTIEDALVNAWPQIGDKDAYITPEQRELEQELAADRLVEEEEYEATLRQEPVEEEPVAKEQVVIKPAGKKPFIIPKKKKKPFVIPPRKTQPTETPAIVEEEKVVEPEPVEIKEVEATPKQASTPAPAPFIPVKEGKKEYDAKQFKGEKKIKVKPFKGMIKRHSRKGFKK